MTTDVAEQILIIEEADEAPAAQEYCHYICPYCYPHPTDPTFGLCGSLLICGPTYNCGKAPCPDCIRRSRTLVFDCEHGR